MSGEALRDAVCDGDLELTRKLVEERNASVDHVDVDDGWPLVLWAVKAHQTHCLEFLLTKGANTHLGDGLGNTALHKAAYLGHDDCVKLLIKHGADPLARNLSHQTPRDLAELFDRKNIVDLLARLSPEQDASSNNGSASTQ